MTAPTLAGTVMAFLAMALAGCTGGFQVEQTEPLRIQLEGAPETVTVADSDEEAKRVVVETCGDDVGAESCAVEEVDVQVEIKRASDGPCRILVTIQDEEGRTLTSRVIDLDAPNSTSATSTSASATGTTTGNGTSSNTSSPAAGQVVIQNMVVNVKGHKNIVVVTQAQQGSADVNIQAAEASGQADVDQNSTATATVSPTATMTSSASATSTGP